MKKLLYILPVVMITSCMNGGMKDAANNKAKEGVQHFYDDVINAHNPAAAETYCTADFVDHNPDQGHSGKGMDDLKAEFKDFFAAFPDVHATTKFMIAQGDTVIAYLTMTGTNSGPMSGMPATNKQMNVDGVDIIVLKDGKATDRWGFFDSMKMMAQLGMMGGQPDASKMASQTAEEPKK